MPAMVMNAPPNGSNGVDTSTSGARHNNSLLQKTAPMRRRSWSKGTISGFASTNDHSHDKTPSDAPPPAHPHLSADSNSGAMDAKNQPQHAGDSTLPPPPPPKPSHSARMALVSVQNAIYMGARTQVSLCPPGKPREDLTAALQSRRRKKKNLPQPLPIRRSLSSLSFQRSASISTVGSRSEEISVFEKFLGEASVGEYGHEEDKFLYTKPENRNYDLNSDGEEILEDPSSGDNDELDVLFEDEEASKGVDENNSDKESNEPIYLCGTEAVSDVRGSANSGKIAFNFRKVKWFDGVTATDRAAARQYLKKEIQNMKKRDLKALTNHLKKSQRREKRRIEIEKGRRSRSKPVSDRLFNDDDGDDSSHNLSGVGKLPSPMTPSLSAALLLESLSLNPLESIEGMAKCYEGIVAAGLALLDSKIEDPTGEKRKHSKAEIMNALAPILITTLEKASGDTILALAKLRKSCGTKRYKRRFVQRIAPSLIRPPNAAMWCLRHQQDMESIIAATELILDKSSDVFHKEWFERGRTILADSKRAETLKAAAMQLKNLSAYQPSDRLMKGTFNKGSHHRRSISGNFFQTTSKENNGSTTEVMAEWEILAVDRQIRDSIHNLFNKDWQRVVLTNAPARDGEPSQSKKIRGISAGKSKASLSLSENDTNSISSTEQSQYVTSPPRMSHNRMLPSTNSVPFAPTPGSRGSGPPESSPNISKGKEHKNDSHQLDPYDPLTPPHTPRNNENDFTTTPPRSPPHAPNYTHSPRHNPLSPPKYSDSISMGENSRTPAPLSPVNSYRRQHEPSHQRFSSNSSGSSPNAQSLYLRTLTSTAAERKRTVAACRALRAQIARFEDAFIKMHGRPPKGAAERAPLATTYAQYREWKRAIRADAASRIQALFRGAHVRSYLAQDPKFKEIVRRRAGRPKKVSYSHLSLPESIGNEKSPKLQPQPVAPMPRRDDGSVEIVMGPASAWPKRSLSDSSYDSTLNSSQYPSVNGSVSVTNSFKHEIALYSHVELQAQKRELKQELKKYDMSFYNQNGRMPVKAEKEPIRHLYEKYNQLKNRIINVERDPSLIQQSIPGPRRIPNVHIPAHMENNNNSNKNNSSSDDSQSNNSSSQRSRSDSFKRQQPSPGPSSNTQDLGALKTEKQTLHQMLRSYEKEFFKKYNRQVSSYTDIRPVASQYRRYKEIKKLILALQPAGEK